MKTKLSFQKIFYALQFAVIFILHFVLLYWIYYALSKTGELDTMTVMYHFMGMALYGSLLIAGCAKWARYHFVKDVRAKRRA